MIGIANAGAQALVTRVLVVKNAQGINAHFAYCAVVGLAIDRVVGVAEVIKRLPEPFFRQRFGEQATAFPLARLVVVRVEQANLIVERLGLEEAVDGKKVFRTIRLVTVVAAAKGDGTPFFLEPVAKNGRTRQSPGMQAAVVVEV